jgi:hypothetical protein
LRNAHERFGTLEFTKRVKEATTHVKVWVDRAVLQPPNNEREQTMAHLLSLIGGDAEVAAVWAAVTEGAFFTIHLPSRAGVAASLGPEAQCFRGSLMIPDRKRPVRHLVALSAELAKTKPGADRDGSRTVLSDNDPAFVLYRVASRYGLPVVPEWADWFMRELRQRKSIRPLLGLGCAPVLVHGNKPTFLKWISRALREGSIRIPQRSGSISWQLPRAFLGRVNLQDGESQRIPSDAVACAD